MHPAANDKIYRYIVPDEKPNIFMYLPITMTIDASRPSFTYQEKKTTLSYVKLYILSRVVSPLQSRQVTPPVPI